MQLPKQMLKAIPKEYFDPANNTLKLLWEEEWRELGITQVKPLDVIDPVPVLTVFLEPGLGTLRSPRTRTTYPTIQVHSSIQSPHTE